MTNYMINRGHILKTFLKYLPEIFLRPTI